MWPDDECVVHISIPAGRLVCGFFYFFRLEVFHVEVGDSRREWGAHGHSVCLFVKLTCQCRNRWMFSHVCTMTGSPYWSVDCVAWVILQLEFLWKETPHQSWPLDPLVWFLVFSVSEWPHGQEKLMEFLNYLNGIHNKIQFTMEIEEPVHLPFLDIDMYRKIDSSLWHKVYRKLTHTNLYLHQKSHHHPAKKLSVLSSLLHRAKTLCDQESLAPELTLLKNVFK